MNRPLLWYIAAGMWFMCWTWADAYIMGSGEVIPKAWLLIWYGPPLFLTLKLISMGGAIALAVKGAFFCDSTDRNAKI